MPQRLQPFTHRARIALAPRLPAALALTLAFVMASGLAPARAEAQTVYRCGPDGREYSQRPCPAGAGREVDVADPRSEAARAAGEAEADRQREAAEDLAKQRRVYESQGQGQGLSRPPQREPAAAEPAEQPPKPTERRASTRAHERIRIVSGSPAPQATVQPGGKAAKAKSTVKPSSGSKAKASAEKKKPKGDSSAS